VRGAVALAAFACAFAGTVDPARAYCTSNYVAGLSDRYHNALLEVATLKRTQPGAKLDATEKSFVRDTLGDIGDRVRACVLSEKNDERAFLLRVLDGYVAMDQGYWDALGGATADGNARTVAAIRDLEDATDGAVDEGLPPIALGDARRAIHHGYARLYEIGALAARRRVGLR
jgi:hypothetical protein